MLYSRLGTQINFIPITRLNVRTVFLFSVSHLPRAPLPAQGVTSPGVMSMHDIKERYLPFIAHTAHAPDQNPLIASMLLLINESLQVVAGPCWELVILGVISAFLT